MFVRGTGVATTTGTTYMSNNNIPQDIKPSRRRTKFMIEQENDRILEYYKAGASHKQIMQFVNLSERQYWRRVKQIQLKDIEICLHKQTKESRAFLHQRMIEKLQAYQQGATSIAMNKAFKPTDRLAAFQLLRQLAADEYSLETYGPASFLIPGLNDRLYRGSRETAVILREAVKDPERDKEPTQRTDARDANRVF